MKMFDDDANRVTNFFLEGVSLTPLLSAMKSSMIDEDKEGRVLVVNMADTEELTKAALQFYQGDFDPRSELATCAALVLSTPLLYIIISGH